MSSMKTALIALLMLAACDGNPFLPEEVEPDPVVDPEDLPGTTNPSPDSSIVRMEPTEEGTGNGFVSSASYNEADDTFTVDGLAFDGSNVYQRDSAVPTLGGYDVFEGDATYTDPVTGEVINQFGHRALYGVSRTGSVEFAIVRTGAYVTYGFGGFVYQRNGGVTLPTSGQAHYEGDYAALRDFSGAGGLEYSEGTMVIDIDFDDFNDGAAVRGFVTDRVIYDSNGNDITDDYLVALSENTDTPVTELPVLTFTVSPTAMDENGEIAGTVGSYYEDGGAAVEYETGEYYAVVGGETGDEIVGVIVIEAADPRADGVIVRETGGFIVYRE